MSGSKFVVPINSEEKLIVEPLETLELYIHNFSVAVEGSKFIWLTGGQIAGEKQAYSGTHRLD